MILKLAWRDPAWMVGSVVIGTYLVVLLTLSGRTPPGNLLWNVVPMLGALMFYLKPQRRATLWEAALPITGRQLMLAQALSRVALVWISMTVCAWLTRVLKGAGWSSAEATVACGAVLTLAILLPQAVRVQELVIPWWLVGVIWAAVTAAGILAWWLLPVAVTLAFFAAADAAVFARIWMTVPLSFQTAPLEAAGRPGIRRSRMTTALPPWPVVRSFPWSTLGCLPLVSMLPSVWMCGCFFGVLAMQGGRPRTRWMDSLPLSHRFRLLINMLPALVMVVGVAIGWQFALEIYPITTGDETTLADGRPGTPNVEVPLEFWKHAGGGAAPVLESPWGETFRPAVLSAFGYTLYNPYSAGPYNSWRFFEWQFARATEAAYGSPLGPRQLITAEKAGLKPITERPRMRILNLAAMALCLLTLTVCCELFRWRRVRALSRRVRFFFTAAVASLPLSAIVVLLFMPTPRGSTVVATHDLIQGLLLRISALLPDNLLAVTLAAAVPVALMYLLLERLFAQTEFLGPVRVASPWSAED